MGDHHAFGTRSGAAGVIDSEQIGLMNFRTREFSRARVDQRFVVEPAFGFSGQSDEVLNFRDLFANTIDRSEVLAVCANHPRTAMIDQVNEVVSGEPIV